MDKGVCYAAKRPTGQTSSSMTTENDQVNASGCNDGKEFMTRKPEDHVDTGFDPCQHRRFCYSSKIAGGFGHLCFNHLCIPHWHRSQPNMVINRIHHLHEQQRSASTASNTRCHRQCLLSSKRPI